MSRATYKGPVPCLGCGLTGYERNRARATSLCPKCYADLRLAETVARIGEHRAGGIDGVRFVWNGSLRHATGTKGIISALTALLKMHELPSPSGQQVDVPYEVTMRNCYHRAVDINVPRKVAETAVELLSCIGDAVKDAREAGIEEGASLLRGLHSGRVSVADFEERTRKVPAKGKEP